MVEGVVATVLEESSSPHQHRVTVVNKLVEALERDAAWVDLYGITGELKVPDTPSDNIDPETSQLLDKAKKVCLRSLPFHALSPDDNI